MYRGITPRIMIEKLLGQNALCVERSSVSLGIPFLPKIRPRRYTPPADWKFHCYEGKVKWLQYIYWRGIKTTEANYDRNFKRITDQLDPEFEYSQLTLTKPDNWEEIISIAEQNARGLDYVRVDLYNIRGHIYFGEMTFFPRSGCYPGVPKIFGDLLLENSI